MNTLQRYRKPNINDKPYRYQASTFLQKTLTSRLYLIRTAIALHANTDFIFKEAQRLQHEMTLLCSDKQFAELIFKNYDLLKQILVKNTSYNNQKTRLMKLYDQSLIILTSK